MKAGVPGPPEGWGLDNALVAWGKFWRREYYPYRTLFRLGLPFVLKPDHSFSGEPVCGIDDPE